jgi:hypothetical protein
LETAELHSMVDRSPTAEASLGSRQDQFVEGTNPMNIILWVLQVFLAVAFLAHGWIFLFPPAAMVELMRPILLAFEFE